MNPKSHQKTRAEKLLEDMIESLVPSKDDLEELQHDLSHALAVELYLALVISDNTEYVDVRKFAEAALKFLNHPTITVGRRSYNLLGPIKRELAEELFVSLVISDNTAGEEVRRFADKLLKSMIPTTITVGGRTYNLRSFLQGDEESVSYDVMIARVREMGAYSGKEVRKRLMKYQDDIPAITEGKILFVFTEDRHLDHPERICCVFSYGGRLVKHWFWSDSGWCGRYRVLCPESA